MWLGHRVISATMTSPPSSFLFNSTFHCVVSMGLSPSLPLSHSILCQIISARLYSPPLQSFLVTAAKGAPNECEEKDDALHCQMQNKEWKFFLSLSRVLSNIVDVIWRDPRRKKFRMLSPNSRIPYSNENVGMLVLLWRTSVYMNGRIPPAGWPIFAARAPQNLDNIVRKIINEA